MRPHRRNHALSDRRQQQATADSGRGAYELSPSARRACAWLLGWQEGQLTQTERSDRDRFVETLCRIEPTVAAARELALRLFGLARIRDLDGFNRWLAQAHTCPMPDLQRFATGLEADLLAMRAAFSSPWSSRQVEGQINRLKYLKRQMYGRAKLDLMRIRVLYPNCPPSQRLRKSQNCVDPDTPRLPKTKHPAAHWIHNIRG